MDNTPVTKPERNRSLISLTAMIAAALILTNIITGLIFFFVGRTTLYPTPINRNIYDIDYSQSDDHLAVLSDMLVHNVVEVRADGVYYGTGIIMEYDANDYPLIITNFHVISKSPHEASDAYNQNNIEIRLYQSLIYYGSGSIEVLGYDTRNDIAVLRLKKKVKKELDIYNGTQTDEGVINHIGSSKNLAMGQRVLALGNAIVHGISACDGIVSLPEYYISDSASTKIVPIIQITAPINGGNSGGPLFDMQGKLIGINTYQSWSAILNGQSEKVDNISYSVPIDIAIAIYENIKDNPKTDRAITQRQASLYEIKINSNTTVGRYLKDNVLGVDFVSDFRVQDDQEIQFIKVYNKLSSGESDILATERKLEKDFIIVKIGDYEIEDSQGISIISYTNIMAELLKYKKAGTGTSTGGKPLVIEYRESFGSSTVKTATIDSYIKVV